jgi:FkbM family methyltransferase
MALRFFKNAIAGAARRWRDRERFARTGDWLMTLYDALLRYATRVPLPLRGRAWPVRLATEARPLFLRLGSSDGFVMEEIFVTGVYAPLTSPNSDARKLDPVKQIVDLGANAGFSVRLWRSRFPDARVIAVEPDPGNFTACRMNVEASPHHSGDRELENRTPVDDHVRLVQACVAARDGTVYLDRSSSIECAFAMTQFPVGQPVPARTLPAILSDCAAEPVIDVLKVDIEGAERELFADCAGWIGRVRSIMIELHSPYGVEQFMEDLRRAGAQFRVEWTGETAGNPLLFLTRR